MDKKKVKVAVITFVVLGITGVAILKGKSILDGIRDKRRKKSGKPEKVGLFHQIFELPDDLKS